MLANFSALVCSQTAKFPYINYTMTCKSRYSYKKEKGKKEKEKYLYKYLYIAFVVMVLPSVEKTSENKLYNPL